jgi:hypothetical protein
MCVGSHTALSYPVKALKKRLINKQAFLFYPKDEHLIKYQYARCNFYFNKLSGNKFKALEYLTVLLLRWPSIFIRDMVEDKARRTT